MASLEATLEVAGQRYPLVHATFGVSQPTGRRGRAATKVRYSLVELALDVPLDDRLLSWATDPTQRQAASLIFSDATTGNALETLRLNAAYCVGYREEFTSGAEGTGSYYCALVLSDPDGFTMQAGGPSAAFVGPAAGTHGVAVLAPLLVPAAEDLAEHNVLALSLRKELIPLPGFTYLLNFAYTKRSNAEREILRKQFENGGRKAFLSDLTNNPAKISRMEKLGMSPENLERIKQGQVPKGYQVHHKLPLDDGGDNSFDNLVLIQNDPYHLAVTVFQNNATRALAPGEAQLIDWPVVDDYIYPNY